MKPIVKKCECGILTNPIMTNIVTNAWILRKKGTKEEEYIAFFEFYCPSCKKKNVIAIEWIEN